MIAPHPLDRVFHLLEVQRVALLAGDIAAATNNMDLFEKLMRMLNSNDIGEDALRQLRETARRNERLLFAARAGLNAARAVLQPRPSIGFRGYDASGKSDVIGGPKSKIEKRS